MRPLAAAYVPPMSPLRPGAASLATIVGVQFDRRAMWCPLRCSIPGVAILPKHLCRCDALLSDDSLQRSEPMAIIGLSRAGIAGGLRLLDLLAEFRRPFAPRE